MKCLACRLPLPGYNGDLDDIQFLIRKMGISTMQEVEAQIERFYPHVGLTLRARELIGALLPKRNSGGQ